MSNTYTTAHALHRALDRLLVGHVASREAIARTAAGERLIAEGLTALVEYERLREHARLRGPTDALGLVLWRAAGGESVGPWEEVPAATREHWRGLAQAVLFSGLVTA